jgi:hypothetical protein
MERDEWIQRQRRRYLAQILGHFDEHILPHLPPAAAGDVQDFKGLVRARVNALAVDANEMAQNLHAQELRESLSPDGRM